MKTKALHLPRDFSRRFPPDERYLVGVSGGRDSIALLHLLLESDYKNLVVCHLDHQLRGRASSSDAKFVNDLAARLDLSCEIGGTSVRALAKDSRLSLETAARVARFAFFVKVARRRRCRKTLLAHHADDLVETALFNLCRGSGPAGFAAMKEVSRYHLGRTELTIVRPLLAVWRSEIDAYVKENRLKFREDATNTSPVAMRNRIRHHILPMIEKEFGRDVRRSLWRTAQIWNDENALLDSLLPIELTGRVELGVKDLRQLPVALQRRAILGWLRQHGIAGINFEIVESVRELLEPQSGKAKGNLAGGRFVRRKSGRLFLA